MCEYDGCKWEETISQELWKKILGIGHKLDLNKGGLWDSRLEAICLWVSPEDHPPSWDGVPITKGALKYPRSYLAGFLGEPKEGSIIVHLVIAPYGRVEATNPRYRYKIEEQSTRDELEWCLRKWGEIKELAEKELSPPEGIFCRFCDRYIKVVILNEFFEHLKQHGIEIYEIFLGEKIRLRTNIGILEF